MWKPPPYRPQDSERQHLVKCQHGPIITGTLTPTPWAGEDPGPSETLGMRNLDFMKMMTQEWEAVANRSVFAWNSES